MKLKLSEIPEYKEYAFSLMEKDYRRAEIALKKCINFAKEENDKEILIFLTQNLGDLYFITGDRKNALSYYKKAELLDEKSVLSKYIFAKFLADKLKDYEKAIEKCNEIIEITIREPWEESEYDFGSKYYLALAYSLQGYCYALLQNYHSATRNLFQLLSLKEKIINHSIDFCELMIRNGISVNEAKTYLTNILLALSKKDSIQYEELTSSIERILNM